MSTAIAEPPAAVQQEAVAAETNRTAPITQANPVKLQLGGIVAALNKAQNPLEKTIQPEPVKAEPEKPAEPLKEEKKVEEVKPPVQEEKPGDPEIKHNASHFKVVVEARDKALARLKELETELETRKTKPRDEDAQKLSDYEKQLAEERKTREELQARVREVDISKDPEFQKKYDEPIRKGVHEVFEYLTGAGVDKAAATELVNKWDLRGMSDAAADMDEVSKGLMMSAIRETMRVDRERTEQLKQPEDFASRRRVQQEEIQKKSVAERLSFVEQTYAEILQATPALADEANIALSNEMKNAMIRVAKAEANPKELIAFAAQATALQAAVTGQHAALVDMQTQLQERDKKIAELETFVKNNGGSTLRPDAVTKSGEGDKYIPTAERIVVRI